MAKGQRQRKSKTSNGSAIGSKGVSLNEVQKVLLGHGLIHTSKKKTQKPQPTKRLRVVE